MLAYVAVRIVVGDAALAPYAAGISPMHAQLVQVVFMAALESCMYTCGGSSQHGLIACLLLATTSRHGAGADADLCH